jgi:hypothetical protein|uniref:Uncharacterized protein n=1 Tax=viral metagenome TaxID=1070528 RepID=A0A6C0LW15_9ZZZZ
MSSKTKTKTKQTVQRIRNASQNPPKAVSLNKKRVRVAQPYPIKGGLTNEDERNGEEAARERATQVSNDLIALSINGELTQQHYNDALKIIIMNILPSKYPQFIEELNEMLDMNKKLNETLTENETLTRQYYNKQICIPIILNVFTYILPDLIKANIPENIVSLVIMALRAYNFQLLIYYYRFFMDPHNPGIVEVRKGKIVTEEINNMIADYASSNNITLVDRLISIKSNIENFLKTNNIFDKDRENSLRFVFLYLAIFIVMLYIAMHFNYDEFKNILEKLNTTPVNLQGSSTRISLLGGGKKNSKSNNSTKPKKRAAVIKKASPKKASPKKVSPKKVISKKASPKI